MLEPEKNTSDCLRVEALQKDFDASGFDSGRPSLDDWLKRYAWQNHAGYSSRTYVVRKNKKIVGYYTIRPGSIKVEEVTGRIRKGQPKEGTIAIIKLCRLAVDKEIQGTGLGKALLKDALLRCITAADKIAGRAVIVDALDDSIRTFYERFGFESGPINKNTMMILMKDLGKAYKES